MFLCGVLGWLADRNIPVLPGSEVDTQKRPSGGTERQHMFSLSSRDKVGCKHESADQLGREVEPMHAPDVYTDGSDAEEAPREGFAGYGVWFGPMHPQNISAFLPGLVQMNNRADLTACIEALRVVPLSQPIRIITDSKYIFDGVTAHMHR